MSGPKECPHCGYPRGSSHSLELLEWAYKAGRQAERAEAAGEPLARSGGWKRRTKPPVRRRKDQKP